MFVNVYNTVEIITELDKAGTWRGAVIVQRFVYHFSLVNNMRSRYHEAARASRSCPSNCTNFNEYEPLTIFKL